MTRRYPTTTLAKDIFSIVFKEAFITRGPKNLWQGLLDLTLFGQFSVCHLNLAFYIYSLFTLRCRTLFYYGMCYKTNINRRGCMQPCYNPRLTIPRKGGVIIIPMTKDGDWIRCFCPDKIYQNTSRDLNLRPFSLPLIYSAMVLKFRKPAKCEKVNEM